MRHARFAAPFRGLLLLAFVFTLPAAAQEIGSRQRVVLADGRVVVGTVVSADADVVVLDVSGLRTEVPRAQIERMSLVGSGRFYRSDPNYTRLFFSPTARTLEAGTGRITTYYYIMPSVAYGFGRVDVSAATTIPVGGSGVLSGNVKAGLLQNETVSVAVGASALRPYGSEFSGGGFGGTVYGLASLGNRERGVTIGGFGVYGVDTSDDADVALGDGFGLIVGGEYQISNSLKLMLENVFLIPNDGTEDNASFHIGGVRFFGDQLAADIGLVAGRFGGETGGGLEFIPIPYVGFAYNFGR